ncbi:hypothetical protein FHX37_0579 [Haloactinospora alba]|uniref:Uncharacterized protein n=1 Tax=Haloactinospora alba TaxID=405555 RepID=A0A543NFT4_9ACTN|nr:hypothetical protein [Haloactinospora alba]TQN30697.1 hypothetical protein FHX37_0579 [Haloactinospora alba]
MDLTPHQCRELRDLADQLVQDTRTGSLWPSRIRATARELRTRLNTYLAATEVRPHDAADATH